jgi:protein-S-isoprenylcysteine O-methyltransferase Ste14
MKASAWEQRWRYLVYGVIYALGFTAPWNYLLNQGAGDTGFWSGKAVWLPAALAIERAGGVSLTGAANLLLGLGIFFALAGAALRTWGAAYPGTATMEDGGPYRYMRNPLEAGTLLHTLAVALLMPLSGALFAVVAMVVEQIRLIGGQEAILEARWGERYLAYKQAVPRIVPALRARVARSSASRTGSGARPAWGMAVLREIYFWGVAVAFASVGMRYNALLVIQGVVVALGVAMVARAFVPRVVTA